MTVTPIGPDVRRTIRQNIWLSIAELSDLDFQSATWGVGPNLHYTWIEFVECFFDSFPSGIAGALQEGLVLEHEAGVLKSAHDALDGYDPPEKNIHDERAILADPNWQRVVEIVDASRVRLGSLLNDEERRMLSRESNVIPDNYPNAAAAKT